MFLIGTASLSFFSGYGSAHLHKITRRNIYVSKNTLKRGNIKRDPYIDLDVYFCKLWTHILQVEINIDISTFIFGSGNTYRNLNIYTVLTFRHLFDKHKEGWVSLGTTMSKNVQFSLFRFSRLQDKRDGVVFTPSIRNF